MTSKQIDTWLKKKYPGQDRVIKTNISGCPFWQRKGFPDYHINGIGFVEVKRDNETIKPEQIFWLKRLGGFVYRFTKDVLIVTRYQNGQIMFIEEVRL